MKMALLPWWLAHAADSSRSASLYLHAQANCLISPAFVTVPIMAHIRQSRPYFGLFFQVKVLKMI